jgi:hypothetical protein
VARLPPSAQGWAPRWRRILERLRLVRDADAEQALLVALAAVDHGLRTLLFLEGERLDALLGLVSAGTSLIELSFRSAGGRRGWSQPRAGRACRSAP